MGRSLWVLLGLVLLSVTLYDFRVSADVIPSENECRPYIEKAIHELKNVDATGLDDKESTEASLEENASLEPESVPETGTEEDDGIESQESPEKSLEDGVVEENKSEESPSDENKTDENDSVEETAQETESPEAVTEDSNHSDEQPATDGDDGDSKEETTGDDGVDSKEQSSDDDSKEQTDNDDSKEEDQPSETPAADDGDSKEVEDDNDSKEETPEDGNDSKEGDDSAQTEENQEQDSPPAEAESEQANDGSNEDSTENENEETATESVEDGENQTAENDDDSKEVTADSEQDGDSKEAADDNDSKADDNDSKADDNDSKADDNDSKADDSQETQSDTQEESVEETVRAKRSLPDDAEQANSGEQSSETAEKQDEESQENESTEETANPEEDNSAEQSSETADSNQENDDDDDESQEASEESMPEEDLTMEFEIPKNLRPREHISDLLGLDAESSIKENALKRTGDVMLKELKRIYDNAVRPLESMYKYRDLSNRHFGDPEIFSKPLVLFMGPWSGGKSTILNYLTDNEYTPNSIRSGAEPSPAYFNILMHGDEPEVLDGTQLAADWTFSGLQKFGQGLNDRLRGQKLPNKLLERVNIVEIPGILEVRKQVSRYFPFNDACQWFIDRADIIFLVYDPSKLDVGPETEAILDQLKGREYQTRILLNKADQVKPEELLRVQGALIWNISPLMSSAQPPVMYTVSLWSHPFEVGAPVRLLQAQEKAFLTDLREAIDKRIENKIASARRFAVRIRNHAKMVDCYLTTYYNQKSLFSNKKHISDKIIEHPQNYNIYEGLSTLTNISRYDLPDPEVYLDFFRLNPLYEFKKLSETCTYFKGCPINKLDIAIAYDLPELVGKYKKSLELNLVQLRKEYDENCNHTEPEPQVKIINTR